MDDEFRPTAKGCATWGGAILAFFLLMVILGFVGNVVGLWQIQIFGVAYQNANTSVVRCSNEYLTTTEDKIRFSLNQIATNDTEIANLSKDPSNANLVQSLKDQELTDANSVYTALDHFSCQKSQLYADMGDELQPFFNRWNGPTNHNYSTVTP